MVKSFSMLSLLWLVFLGKQLWLTENIGDRITTSKPHTNPALGPIPGAKDPLRLVFLISMGQEALESKLVERFVWSARHGGGWQGWIMLLTDAPLDRYHSIQKDDPSLLVVNPLHRHFNASFGEDMPYKRFKTHVIDYVNADDRLNDVRLIYYLDVDIIVGNSLPTFFHDIEAAYSIPKPDGVVSHLTPLWLRQVPKIWFFQNKYAHMSVQGGQFVVDRYSSQPCLDFWRELIDSNVTEVKDQPALQKMRQHQIQRIDQWLEDPALKGQTPPQPARCQIVTMTWEKYLHFPANSTVFKAYDKIRKKKSLVLPTLIHFKNSCNSTSQINDFAEEAYIEYVLQGNKELAQKIHVQPDGEGYAGRGGGRVNKRMQHVAGANGTIHLE
jgi:hypothetical protein